MPRIRQDNDARYALRASFVDEQGNVITGDTIVIPSTATDPRITNQQITNWDTAFSWGDHASAGYLTSFTETDPTVPAHVKSITTTEKSNWNTAYSWGNHASAGYASASSLSGYVSRNFEDSSRNLVIPTNTTSGSAGLAMETSAGTFLFQMYGSGSTFGFLDAQWGNWDLKKTSGGALEIDISGTLRTVWHTGDFTSTNVSNWNTAYGWGNHASAGYITNSGGTTTATANTVAKRDSSADLHARLFRSNYANQSSIAGGIAFRNNNSSDNYIRFCSDGAAIRSFIGAGTSSFSGNYNDLSNKPTIPTNNNQLTNGAGYITSSGSISGNAATATWADQVDVNSGQSSQNAWYDVVWHSGDTVYSSPSVEIYPAGGYLRATYFNATHGSTARTSDTIFYSSTDDYIRKTDAASFRTSLNVPTRTGGNASGTWGISITGNAGSASSVAWGNVTGKPSFYDGSDAVKTANNSSLNSDSRNTRGVTRLYRRDSNSDYSVQTHWTGARWYLAGYNSDTYHAECEVYYATVAGSASSVAWSNVTGAPTIPTNNNQLTNGAGYITSSGSCAYATNSGAITFSGATKLYGYASGGRATGDFLATGDIYAYYSDQRLKDVSGPLTDALAKISTLDGVYYTHNEKARELGYSGSERQVGLLAQQVEAVLPEVIGRAPIDNDGEGGSITGENYITVKYERIVPLLVEGIKELTKELECVKLELAEMKRGV